MGVGEMYSSIKNSKVQKAWSGSQFAYEKHICKQIILYIEELATLGRIICLELTMPRAS